MFIFGLQSMRGFFVLFGFFELQFWKGGRWVDSISFFYCLETLNVLIKFRIILHMDYFPSTIERRITIPLLL